LKYFLTTFFLVAVGSASADGYDLYELVNGTIVDAQCTVGAVTHGCFIVGDKQFVFDAATLTGGPAGTVVPAPGLAPGYFSVIPLLTGNLYGFEIHGTLSAISTGGVTSVIDLAIAYTVATTSGLPLITDLHAALNGGCEIVSGAGGCVIKANETAVNASALTVNGIVSGGNVLTTNPLSVNLGNSPVTDLFISPQSFIRVSKDISVQAISVGGTSIVAADLSVVDQYVSQTPEPGFYGALALGLSGLTLVVRRRKHAA
jgi:hypothetical protein